jgi:hypothetical protein
VEIKAGVQETLPCRCVTFTVADVNFMRLCRVTQGLTCASRDHACTEQNLQGSASQNGQGPATGAGTYDPWCIASCCVKGATHPMVWPSCDTTSTTTLNAKGVVDSVGFPWTATVMPALTLEKTLLVVTSTRDTDTGAIPSLTSLPLDHAQAQ